MTDKNLTELVCVLDRSGSMHSIIDDAIGGIDGFIAEQQGAEGEARMTTVLFDHEIQTVHESVPIADVKPFTRETYVPRGSTALRDAVGSTIDFLGQRLRSLPEDRRPGRVLFIILTDGHENASTRYGHQQLKQMIERQQNEWQWQFIYLSADVDAFAHGAGLGIGTQVSYQGTSASVAQSFCVASTAAKQYRAGGAKNVVILDSCSTVDKDGAVSVDSNVDSDAGSGTPA